MPVARSDGCVVDLVGVTDTVRSVGGVAGVGPFADRRYGGRSLKKQMTAADRSGARWAVIIGSHEAEWAWAGGRDPVESTAVGSAARGDRGVVAHRDRQGTVVMRSHRAGDLRAGDIGSSVAVCGWVASRRDHGGKVVESLTSKDGAGHCAGRVDRQMAGLEESQHDWARMGRARSLKGANPEGTVNDELPTGAVEVVAREIEVLSEAEPSPFPLDDRVDVDEVLRLRHRYLDLRRAPMQRNLRLRAAVNRVMREAMAGQDFVEIETPMLIASTPEGARDFVVRRVSGRASSTRCRRVRSCSSSC